MLIAVDEVFVSIENARSKKYHNELRCMSVGRVRGPCPCKWKVSTFYSHENTIHNLIEAQWLLFTNYEQFHF